MLTRSHYFSCRGLGRFAFAFYVLCISTPARAASFSRDADDTMNFILFVVVIFLLFAAIFALNDAAFNKSKRLKKLFNIQGKVKAQELYPKHFTVELKKRFPCNKIYFVPESICELLKISPEDGNAAYRENCNDWWTRMLKMYPEPPHDETEKEEREASFWRMYAGHFTVLDAAQQPALKPKQEILDFFQYWEKWVFRDFYAATGVVHKTIIEELVRHKLDAENTLALDASNYPDGYVTNRLEKVADAEKRFILETRPAHFAEWGGWFHFHVQEAFKAQHQTESNYGPQSAESSSQHPAQDDLSYRPNV